MFCYRFVVLGLLASSGVIAANPPPHLQRQQEFGSNPKGAANMLALLVQTMANVIGDLPPRHPSTDPALHRSTGVPAFSQLIAHLPAIGHALARQ